MNRDSRQPRPAARRPLARALVAALATTALAAAAYSQPAQPAQPAQPGQPAQPAAAQVRMRFQDFVKDPNRLASLVRGIQAMQARDTAPKDSADYRTSWQYWSAVHSYYGPQSTAGTVAQARARAPESYRRFFDGVPDLVPPPQPPGLAQATWNTCQHGTRWFFPWHRLYLLSFERVLRAAAKDDTLRLPYWDYTDPAQVKLPAEFGQPTWQGKPNPLYDWRRTSQTLSLSPQSTDIDETLDIDDYYDFQSEIEGGIHGYVHCSVGNRCITPDMGKVPAAGADAIFYLHHNNLDRIWQCWTTIHGVGANPITDSGWMDQGYAFVDARGAKVSYTVRQLFEASGPIDYTYDNVSNCTRRPRGPEPTVVAAEVEGQDEEKKLTKLATAAGITIDDARESVTLKLPGRGTPEGTAFGAALEGTEEEAPDVELVLDGITAEAQPGVLYHVYLVSASDPGKRAHVGTLSFFGAEEQGHHAEQGHRRLFKVSDELREIGGAGLSGGDVQVVFEATTGLEGEAGAADTEAPAAPAPTARVRVRSIELRVRPD